MKNSFYVCKKCGAIHSKAFLFYCPECHSLQRRQLTDEEFEKNICNVEVVRER